jgi:hypothetical protein
MSGRNLRRLLIGAALFLLAWPVMAQDDDGEAEPLPVIPYYTSQEGGQQFNIPIPSNWAVVDSNETLIRMASPAVDDSIYVIAEEAVNQDDAVLAGLERILPDHNFESRYQSSVTIDGLPWGNYVFDITEGGTVSAFARAQDDQTYVMYYINQDDTTEIYMPTVEVDEEGAGLQTALEAIYPGFDAEPQNTSEVRLSSGVWIRNDFELEDGGELHTLHQERFGKTYVVIENGDGTVIDAVNKSLYTSLFGFFITPENTNYLILGLGATFGLIVILVISYMVRHRNAEKDLELIRQLQAD